MSRLAAGQGGAHVVGKRNGQQSVLQKGTRPGCGGHQESALEQAASLGKQLDAGPRRHPLIPGMLAGLQPSIGTVGDVFDNTLAKTTIGLYMTECIREGSPFRTGPLMTLADLEEITSAWVHWYNTSRLMHRLGMLTPVEFENATVVA